MRFPKSQIKENQYTSGGELVNSSTNQIYSGPYWEMNGRYFIGKTSNNNSIELRKIDSNELNRLSVLNKFPLSTSRVLNSNSINNLTADTGANMSSTIPANETIRYFAKQTTVTPTIIKEIDQDTFNKLQSTPVYQTISISSFDIYYGSPVLDSAENSFYGIKAFLGF